MATPSIPVKTPEGLAELSQRQRRLGQRHRTVLLLVDGRRTEAQVRSMAQQAGAGESCFGELLELGLIALPEPPAPPALPQMMTPMARAPQGADAALHVDIPIGDPVPEPGPPAPTPSASVAANDDAPESVLPAARSLPPESVLGDAALGESRFADFDAIDAGAAEDASFEEARGILLRAVRHEAPLTGSLTMLRLRRARTRDELVDLIDEVEARIVKPYRSLAAQQVLRRVRHLLITPGDAQPAG